MTLLQSQNNIRNVTSIVKTSLKYILSYSCVFLLIFLLLSKDGETYNESDDEEPCIEEGDMVRDVMCVQNNADVVREAL